jgi:hypothetical protein
MLRSAINGVVPRRDLVGYRYQMHPNCDLREALNFHGTTNSRQSKFNLDLACKAFGVETSKSEGMDGRAVESFYRAGRHREIADYCLEDVRATMELYEKIGPTILMLNREFRDSEEREARTKKGELPVLPTSEAPFVASVTQTSLALSEALALTGPEPEVAAATTQALVFEKLIKTEEPEEEIPSGV